MSAEVAALLQALDRVTGPFGVLPEVRGDRLEDAGRSFHLFRARLNAIARTGLCTPALTGFGFAESAADARLKAACEGLERFCGINFRSAGARHASYDEMRRDAVSPAPWIRYSEEQRGHSGFQFVRFKTDEREEWIPASEGHSGRTRYVHADLVRMSQHPRLTRASSIGMAIHSDAQRAKDSAILELIERDHLALAFWRGDPCASMPVESIAPELHPHLESMRADGFRVHCVRIDYGLGVVVALWLAFRGSRLPHLLKGAAADRDIASARTRAFDELLRSFLYYRTRPFQIPAQPTGAERNLHHFQTPDVDSRLGFLVGPPMQSSATSAPPARDLTGELHARGITVHFVDMGHRITRSLGLHCVRALSSGLVTPPLGSDPWPLDSPRLRRHGHPRDTQLSISPEPLFFS